MRPDSPAKLDLVGDRITKKNNPNLKNLSSFDLISSPDLRVTYSDALRARDNELRASQQQSLKQKMMRNQYHREQLQLRRDRPPYYELDVENTPSRSKSQMPKKRKVGFKAPSPVVRKPMKVEERSKSVMVQRP